KHASARMKARNPMMNPEVKERMRKKLIEIGHKPRIRGGNGKPMAIPQQLLTEALGWKSEHIVLTKKGRNSGYPGHYKIDIAMPESMIAIEVDGGSHCPIARKISDARKDEFLKSCGWTVLRFSNERVIMDLESCVRECRSLISK